MAHANEQIEHVSDSAAEHLPAPQEDVAGRTVGASSMGLATLVGGTGRPRAVRLAAMAPRFPELQDTSWLRQRYEVEGLSSYAVAAELGCRPTTVSRALRRHGIAARMGRPAVVAPGHSYGRLTVLAELPKRSRGGRVFRRLCACGRETDARAVELRQGKIAPAAACATR
jgi:hypothetical protein